jgi:hypothetical protein
VDFAGNLRWVCCWLGCRGETGKVGVESGSGGPTLGEDNHGWINRISGERIGEASIFGPRMDRHWRAIGNEYLSLGWINMKRTDNNDHGVDLTRGRAQLRAGHDGEFGI